jgi:hypothetical protein
MVRDGRASWQLTAEGRALFGTAETRAGKQTRVLSDLLSEHLKPQGSFASLSTLRQAATSSTVATGPPTGIKRPCQWRSISASTPNCDMALVKPLRSTP